MSRLTLEKLQDKLDKDLSWRKKELSLVKTNIEVAEGEVLNSLIRSGVAILYAHWEGFIKNSARSYLAFLNDQQLKLSDMKDNFLVLHLTKSIIDVKQANKKTKYGTLIDKVFNLGEEFFKVQYKESSIISTESNLKYDVLHEILYSIGLDSQIYELKRQYIDQKLLPIRNKIAHGENTVHVPKQSNETSNQAAIIEYVDLYSTIIELMDDFKEQIISAGIEKKYLKVSV